MLVVVLWSFFTAVLSFAEYEFSYLDGVFSCNVASLNHWGCIKVETFRKELCEVDFSMSKKPENQLLNEEALMEVSALSINKVYEMNYLHNMGENTYQTVYKKQFLNSIKEEITPREYLEGVEKWCLVGEEKNLESGEDCFTPFKIKNVELDQNVRINEETDIYLNNFLENFAHLGDSAIFKASYMISDLSEKLNNNFEFFFTSSSNPKTVDDLQVFTNNNLADENSEQNTPSQSILTFFGYVVGIEEYTEEESVLVRITEVYEDTINTPPRRKITKSKIFQDLSNLFEITVNGKVLQNIHMKLSAEPEPSNTLEISSFSTRTQCPFFCSGGSENYYCKSNPKACMQYATKSTTSICSEQNLCKCYKKTALLTDYTTKTTCVPNIDPKITRDNGEGLSDVETIQTFSYSLIVTLTGITVFGMIFFLSIALLGWYILKKLAWLESVSGESSENCKSDIVNSMIPQFCEAKGTINGYPAKFRINEDAMTLRIDKLKFDLWSINRVKCSVKGELEVLYKKNGKLFRDIWLIEEKRAYEYQRILTRMLKKIHSKQL